MRHSGKFSLVVSLGIHGMLVGAIVLCIGEKNSTPPRIHLVYGAGGPVIGSGRAAATPMFRFAPPSFASGGSEGSQASQASSSGRTGTANGTDMATIPQPIYPKES